MLFRKFDLSQFSDAFDVRAAMIYPWDQVPETPFKSAWGYLEPRKVLKPHAHHEGETFVFFSGRGVMTVSGEATEVTPGDIIYMPPLEPHTLENTSDTESLMFLTIWWEDMELLAKKERLEAERTASRRPTLVISSPPTPNGYLHLGHLAGPYLSGDFHARYLRLRGTDVRFITHSDDNESYVRLRASQHGWTPQEGADHFADSIEASFAAAQIQPDFFLRPNHTPNHRRMVERLFLRLWEKGELVPRAMDVPYCEKCDQYRLECYVRGKCPHCGEGADGFVCESCLWPIDATELLERRCTECSTPTVDRPLTRLFFQPSRHRDALARWYRGSELPPRVRELCERMLAEKLPDVALTQTVGWGTPVPIPGYEGQTIYGAFEIFVAFLVNCQVMAAKEGLAKEEDDFGWQRFYGSPDADVVQFFGADNNYFFAINYPAISLALDLGLQMPARLVPNEFYLLEGKKFSTVRKHLIRLEELKDDVPIDVVRCYLAMTSPETERTNFERAELDRLWQRELRGNWQTWLTDLAAKVRAECGGKSPNPGVWTQDQRRFFRQLQDVIHEAGEGYEAATFSPQRSSRALFDLVRRARRFGKSEDSWRGIPYVEDERQTSIAAELAAAKALALTAAPLLPNFAQRLWTALGFEGKPERWEETPHLVPAGQLIGALDQDFFAAPEKSE